MPVMCGDTIVAVAQLVNKLDGGTVVPFTSIDEDTFLAFAVYAGVCIRTAPQGGRCAEAPAGKRVG